MSQMVPAAAVTAATAARETQLEVAKNNKIGCKLNPPTFLRPKLPPKVWWKGTQTDHEFCAAIPRPQHQKLMT